jgi:hypothetical protein
MRHPTLTDRRQRLKVAEVTGEVERLRTGPDRPDRVEWAAAALRQVTTDAVVLGHVMGSYVAYAEHDLMYQPAVDMLRAAGADEEQARLKAAWLRERITDGRHLF